LANAGRQKWNNMPREKFRAAVARCDHRTVMIICVGRAILIRDGKSVEISSLPFGDEVERFRAIGCSVEYVDVSLNVSKIGQGRKLVELPTGHVITV